MDCLNPILSESIEIPNFSLDNTSNYFLRQSKRNSLLFLVCCAYNQITNRRLNVLSPHENSFYCVDSQEQSISNDIIFEINQSINEFSKSNDTIEHYSMSKLTLAQYFQNKHYKDKLLTLNRINSHLVEIIRFRDMIDLSYGSFYSFDDSSLKNFSLSSPYNNGFFLLFPHDCIHQSTVLDLPKHIDSVTQYTRWSRQHAFDSIHNINQQLVSNMKNIHAMAAKSRDFDYSRIAKIVDILVSEFPKKRMISVAGESSSGKSTFSHNLKQFIERHFGHKFHCQIIQMDSYFLNRDERPLDENGKIDFESINIINIDLLASRIDSLLKGDSIPARRYNYVNGIGCDLPDETISLSQDGFVIVEGLHAINPTFTKKVKNTGIFKIYISPVAPLNIDDNHLLNPDDILLLRRIVRDFNQRGSLPRTNISRWPNVIMSASKYIIPFIPTVNVYYINQLPFELNAMAPVVLQLLQKYSQPMPNEDNSDEITHELNRLIFLLSLFEPIPPEDLPNDLVIRGLVMNTLEKIH